MAYRRKQQQGISSSSSSSSSSYNYNYSKSKPSFEEDDDWTTNNNGSLAPPTSISGEEIDSYLSSSSSSPRSSSSSSLAAKAMRASSAYRDASLSSAYAGHRSVPSPTSTSSSSRYPNLKPNPNPNSNPNSQPFAQEAKPYEYTSMRNLSEPKQGFWGSLARKAKNILDDDNEPRQQPNAPVRSQPPIPAAETRGKFPGPDRSGENRRRTDNPSLQKGLNALTSSFNYIGGTIGTALEEGITMVEHRTADIIQETRKHIKKKPPSSATQNPVPNSQPPVQTDLELQLKASRDVAMAMAAKAKLLLRELKTVKADFAFAKERCAQLEEENKILRQNRERGDNPEDDDLIRLQLETLLAEKARLAHENSVYARENRFLREVVEYHQLTMQDVVYLDEGTEEVTEVYPIKVIPGNNAPSPEVRGISKNAT